MINNFCYIMPFQNICFFEINQVKDRPVLLVINYTTCYNKIFMNKLLSAKKLANFLSSIFWAQAIFTSLSLVTMKMISKLSSSLLLSTINFKKISSIIFERLCAQKGSLKSENGLAIRSRFLKICNRVQTKLQMQPNHSWNKNLGNQLNSLVEKEIVWKQ